MENKPPSLIGIVAVVAILLGLAMAVAGPGSRLDNGWQYLTNGNSTTSQSSAPSAPSGPSIIGGPSLSANFINQVLSNAGSPAAGSGQDFVLGSAQYNIDSAYALAFFHHESSYGTAGAATRTHSIGNIICTPGYSCIGRFRSYPSWQAGIDDWYRLISGPAYAGGGLTTLGQIIPKYAPSSDGNAPDSYVAAVQSDIDAWRQS